LHKEAFSLGASDEAMKRSKRGKLVAVTRPLRGRDGPRIHDEIERRGQTFSLSDLEKTLKFINLKSYFSTSPLSLEIMIITYQ